MNLKDPYEEEFNTLFSRKAPPRPADAPIPRPHYEREGALRPMADTKKTTELDIAKRKYQEYVGSLKPTETDYRGMLNEIYEAAGSGKYDCILDIKKYDQRIRSDIQKYFVGKGFGAQFYIDRDDATDTTKLVIRGWTT